MQSTCTSAVIDAPHLTTLTPRVAIPVVVYQHLHNRVSTCCRHRHHAKFDTERNKADDSAVEIIIDEPTSKNNSD